MEAGRLPELRHDFRHHYGCRYEDVGTDEAIDLINALPNGSRWVAATHPERSWSDQRNRDADLLDAVNVLVWWMALDHEAHPVPMRVTRPRDVIERARAQESARRARQEMESDGWSEV